MNIMIKIANNAHRYLHHLILLFIKDKLHSCLIQNPSLTKNILDN